MQGLQPVQCAVQPAACTVRRSVCRLYSAPFSLQPVQCAVQFAATFRCSTNTKYVRRPLCVQIIDMIRMERGPSLKTEWFVY